MEQRRGWSQRPSSLAPGSTCRLWPTVLMVNQKRSVLHCCSRRRRRRRRRLASILVLLPRRLFGGKKRGPTKLGTSKRRGATEGQRRSTDGGEIPMTAKQASTRRPRSPRRPLTNVDETKWRTTTSTTTTTVFPFRCMFLDYETRV